MKVAICLSGQPRTWKKAYGSWNNLFNLEHMIKAKIEYVKGIVYYKVEPKDSEDSTKNWVLPADTFQDMPPIDNLLNTLGYLREQEKIEVDYFCHLWDFDSTSWGTWTKEQWDAGLYDSGLTDPPSISADVTAFIEAINPVKCVVEDEMKSKTRKMFMDDMVIRRSRNVEKWSTISWAGSQLYGIMMAGHLKKQYEIEKGFQYDVCIRLRPDLLFDSSSTHVFHSAFIKPENHWIYSCHNFRADRVPHYGIGDVFWYSDSETYDLISNFYFWCTQIDPDLFPDDIRIEEILSYLVRMFRMKNFVLPLDPKPTGSKIFMEKKKREDK